MRRIIPALLLPVACLCLHAESTGRVAGKILNKDGKPIPNVKVTLKRSDRDWTKILSVDKHGYFIQVGLDPVEYDMTVTAQGYADQTVHFKVPLADVINENITLLTPDQAMAAAIANGSVKKVEDPGVAADLIGRDAFNKAIPLYNQQKYAEALPEVEKAYKSLTEAIAAYKDQTAKDALVTQMATVERVYGVCLALGSPDHKADAEPFLTKALQANPKDERALAGMIEVAKTKGDKAAQQKYQADFDAIHGPNPDVIYNKAVEAFNAGNMKDAKAHLLKVLQLNAKYPEAYYLLAMVEFGNMDLKATKQNLEKYLELAPNGKNAATARDMLKDPSLKHIK